MALIARRKANRAGSVADVIILVGVIISVAASVADVIILVDF